MLGFGEFDLLPNMEQYCTLSNTENAFEMKLLVKSFTNKIA